MIHRHRIWATIVAAQVLVALAGCQKNPGDECLDSFRMRLKDPDSGKVISFEAGTLRYTATNSYGARIQGSAICKQVEGKWSRDSVAEDLKVLNTTADILGAYNNCRRSGSPQAECAGDSPTLQSTRGDLDTSRLEDEVRRKLGF